MWEELATKVYRGVYILSTDYKSDPSQTGAHPIPSQALHEGAFEAAAMVDVVVQQF